MLQRRSFLKAVAVSFLFTVLAVFGFQTKVVAGQLTLNWGDNSTSEDGFRVERRPGTGTTFAQIATVAANTVSYTDSGLANASTYCYRVQAFNVAGNSGFSNEQCATTAAATSTFTLTVNKNGMGNGTVTGTGISCGADCSEPFASGASVALTASAGSGSTFAGWSGGGCTGTGTCTVTMSAATTVTAAFNAVTQTDTIPPPAPGVPVVALLSAGETSTSFSVSWAASIDQPSNTAVPTYSYSAGYSDGSGVQSGTVSSPSLTLTMPYHSSGAAQAGWICVGAIDAAGNNSVDQSCNAVPVPAKPATYTLTIVKAGTGSGTVTSSPAGINCAATCSGTYNSGASVVLTAAAASGSTFAGWSGGGCTGTCTVTMSAATTVTASFNSTSSFALNVSVVVQATAAGSASGQVVSNPAGIDCGADCSQNYTSGTLVMLTPLPGTGSVFAGWTGNSDCTDGSVTMSANRSCTANFALNQALLTVTTNGNGTVDSTSGGMTCTSSCTFGVALGSSITLRATPSTGASFTGWSGAGCKGTGNCTITLSTNKSVTATFVGSSSGSTDKIGVYRRSTGEWFLDLNGNGVLEGCSTDYCVSSFSGGVPVVGEWDGSGLSQLGMFLTDTAEWRLDKNANETWEGCGVDTCLGPFGQGTDIPVSGRWSAKGYDRIGTFRPSNGRWYLDSFGGKGKWNTCEWDRCAYLKVYRAGDLPVTGDWNGNGTTEVGFFRPATGEWFLDSNGNRSWDGCSKDRCPSSFGTAADLPVSGDWNGTGTSKIGVFRPSTGEWFLDFNGNDQWDGCGIDLCVTNFGQAGDFPVVGKW